MPVFRIKRSMGFQKVRSRLEKEPSQAGQVPRSSDSALEKARQAARMVSIAAAHTLCQTSCLDRSLVLCVLLRRMGIDADLHLGVKKDGGVFSAHAWVELDGEVINDTADVRERFAPFPAPVTKAGSCADM